MLDDYPAEAEAEGHLCITAEKAGRPVGFGYCVRIGHVGPDVVPVVDCRRQGDQKSGLGTRLLKHVEEIVRTADGRVLFLGIVSAALRTDARRFM